jgi:hypothetical protein
MATTINALTTGGGGIAAQGDSSGILALQTGGVTGLSISAAQVVSLTNALATTSGGTGSTSTTYCSLTANVSGILPIANGGTNSSSTTYCSLTTNVTGTLPVANGGTGVTSSTGSVNNVLSTSPTLTNVTLAAGTASLAPLVMTSGTNLTSAVAGAYEYDGSNIYGTIDTTTGRGSIPVLNQFKLTAAGTGITATATGTNYFGTTSNIPLVASAFYEIEILAYFLKTTATTAIWNLVFNAAPTAYNVYYEMSPITGVVAPPGTATMLVGQAYNQTAATYALTTGTLTTAVNHYARFKLYVQCSGTTTSMKINVYNGAAGTITPGLGSYWICRRLPATNVGTYAA